MTKEINEVLSKMYKQPVVAGFNNGGWATVWKASTDLTNPKPEDVIDGGLGQAIAPTVECILLAQAEVNRMVSELNCELDELNSHIA